MICICYLHDCKIYISRLSQEILARILTGGFGRQVLFFAYQFVCSSHAYDVLVHYGQNYLISEGAV
jgi:hypothetical protein